MESTTGSSPLAALGMIIVCLLIGLSAVFAMLGVLRGLEIGSHALKKRRASRDQPNRIGHSDGEV